MKWDMVKLGDVCQIISGTTPTTSNSLFWDGEFNWVTPAEIQEESREIYTTQRTITKQAIQKTGLRELPQGTVLLSSRAPIGKVAIAGTVMYSNQGFKNLICNNKIYNYYLFWFLKAKKDFLNSLGRGATFKEISKEIVSSVQIPLPPLAEQKRIAAILDKANSIRQQRQESLALMDTFIKSAFLDMFGDPVTNPMGWEKGTIRDIVKETQYGTSSPACENGDHIYLRMNNITYSGHLDLSALKYITVSEKDFNKYSVINGDVLFNRTNSKELVGKTCVFRSTKPMIIAGYIIRVRTNERAHPDYLSSLLNSSYGKFTLLGMCKAIVGQANINAQELQNIRITIPPIELQNKFADIVHAVEAQKTTMRQHLREAEDTFKALQQEFFG